MYFLHLILGGLLNAEDLSENLCHAVRLCDCNASQARRKEQKEENKAMQWMLKQISAKKREAKFHHCFQACCVKTS